jgi:hypothetical protein
LAKPIGSTGRGRARKKGGERIGKNPTDRGKPGSKRHLVSDRKGVPLTVALTAANVHGSRALEEMVDALEPIKRPEKLHADKGYDFPGAGKRSGDAASRGALFGAGWTPARSSAITGGWWSGRSPGLARYRTPSVRYERRADIHEAFLYLGCSLMCLNYLSCGFATHS